MSVDRLSVFDQATICPGCSTPLDLRFIGHLEENELYGSWCPCREASCYWQRHRDPIVAHSIAANGVRQYFRICPDCGKRRSNFLAYAALTEEQKAASLLWMPGNGATRWECCERCGAQHVELHHWAPSSLFVDPNSWPKSYLCRACHMEWHHTTQIATGRKNNIVGVVEA